MEQYIKFTMTQGYLLLFGFGALLMFNTWFFGRRGKWLSREGFLVAERKVNWLWGGFSIAASWIWAPALFVSVQVAYQMGLAGLFWFVAPNILALAIFAVLAPKIRAKLPAGFTLPQYIRQRLGSERVHKIYLFPFMFYQLMAVVVQLYAGGSLVSLLTGIPLPQVMLILAAVVLAYTLVSGFVASIVTDFLQLGMILAIAVVIIPMAVQMGGGVEAVVAGFNGISNTSGIWDKGVAFSFGIVTSIGLIAGSIADQSNWQRAFAVKERQVVKAFVFGSVMFGIIPLALSALGFLAANPALGITLPAGVDAAMVGVQTIAVLLPDWAIVLFCIGLLGILSSAFDAGVCAAGSLWATDISKAKDDAGAVKSARLAMTGITLVGLLVSLAVVYLPGFGLQQLWWVFNTIAACVMVPTLLSLYWDKLKERGVFWGIFASFVVGVPLFIYSNLNGRPEWVVGSSLLVVGLSTLISILA